MQKFYTILEKARCRLKGKREVGTVHCLVPTVVVCDDNGATYFIVYKYIRYSLKLYLNMYKY